MGYVQARFGQSYNLRRKSSSEPRWQSRYKARLVEDSGYFHQHIAYIHLNPVVAGLVEDPATYSLLGHLELLGKKTNPLVSVDATLAEYGEGIRSARRAYVRTHRAEREEEWIGEKPGMLPWWKGRPDRPLEPPAPTAWIDELGRSTGSERLVLAASEFLARACAVLQFEPASSHPGTLVGTASFPIQKRAVFEQGIGNQGFARRRTSVRRTRKPAG